MPRNSRYDILFEPVKIGPVVAPNRFYQTPHATGMGNMRPNSSDAMRRIKAEGGWGVVCTEYCSIHPTADESPYAYLTLWDDGDMHQLSHTSEAIHEYGSLAGIELWHGGFHCNNRETREIPLSSMTGSAEYMQPGQVRGMNKKDIKNLRKWHRDAALRAKKAEFDIVYVYAGHEYLPFQFLSPRFNQRTDEYGGSLENRTRLLKELIEESLETVGDRCAVAVRLAVDELHGTQGITHDGDGRAIVEYLAELPDLWDLALGGGLGNDSCSSRFSEEGFQSEYTRFVKSVTSKPVVSVGRFTSPDTMVSQIKQGYQDFIGAARPSIADPFLPNKIKEGKEDEIRECIGCNICRAANNEGVPLRCTQNPTMGEEWRRGWHSEIVPPKHDDGSILIVGGGPAGLEAALTLGKRGYHVTLSEAKDELGGRLLDETTLPGLQKWIRVRDYRTHLIQQMDNVEIFLNSRLTVSDIEEFGADKVVLATGSRWRRDGVGTHVRHGKSFKGDINILTPDDIFEGMEPRGEIIIYDDEHYAMAGALAERYLNLGMHVKYMTPGSMISSWTTMTDEQTKIQSRLLGLGIQTIFNQTLEQVDAGTLISKCIYTGNDQSTSFESLVLVTARQSNDELDPLIENVNTIRIGDCLVPSSIADAVYSGHKFAREFGGHEIEQKPLRERAVMRPNNL